ncbi:MAG: hypothetical protein NVSMB46_03460 [Candidatus Saccharimonadales bacterium]
MKYTKPEGCQAAVTANWERIPGGSSRDEHKLTARMVCGDRNNVCDGSFANTWMNLNDDYYEQQVSNKVSSQVTETLGAMCLGCPYNMERVKSNA